MILIDAPTLFASFLQRMGRTGRRAGSKRNCLSLCTDAESPLFAAGIVRLWLDGYTEPVESSTTPWHIFGLTMPLLVGVRHGRIELVAVDPVCLTAKENRGIILLLGRRNWAVTHVDWTARLCFVEPSRELGRSQWLGSPRAARYEHCQAIRRVLGEDLPEAHLSRLPRDNYPGRFSDNDDGRW